MNRNGQRKIDFSFANAVKYLLRLEPGDISQEGNKYLKFVLIVIGLLLFVLLLIPQEISISKYYDKEYMLKLAERMASQLKTEGLVSKGEGKVSAVNSQFQGESLEKKVNPIIKKVKLSPGRDYEEGLFYLGENIVGRQKIVDGKIVEQTGKTPQGRIEFADDLRETYGFEYYDKGKIHGESKTYYKDGFIKEELEYQYGNLIKAKRYYSNGKLRIDVDYSDAREKDGEKEVGEGKLYFKDGTLKYEWRMTNSSPKGYKKSYNKEGKLISALYYDSNKQN